MVVQQGGLQLHRREQAFTAQCGKGALKRSAWLCCSSLAVKAERPTRTTLPRKYPAGSRPGSRAW